MSYPGYTNYNSYYEAAQNDQAQNSYGTSRSPVSTSSYPDPVAYSTEARQTQYGAQEYSWPTSDQPPYNNNQTHRAQSQGQYAGDRYRDSPSSQTYDYPRAHASHVGSNKRQAETQAYAASARQVSKKLSTPALNDLAYVSGLNSSSLTPSSTVRPALPPQRNHTGSTAALTQPGVQPSTVQQSHDSQSQRGPSYVQQPSHQTTDQNQLALQAVAALQSLPRISRPQATSPAINHAPRVPTPSESSQTSQSQYLKAQTTMSQQTNQSSQSANNQQSSTVGRRSALGPVIKPPPVRPQQSYSVTPNDTRSSAAPKVNSIANLVTTQDRQTSPAHPSPTEESTSTTFINPREVFNPYHREHERVRREAAAAEAAANRTAAGHALKAKNAPPAKPATNFLPEDAIPEPPAKVAKPKSNTAAKMRTLGSMPADENESAAELRQLLARMKELRGKDAALFQKVWDEEKGVPAAKASAVSPITPQQALPVTAHVATLPEKSTPRPPTAPRQLSVSATTRAFNGYTVVIEDNVEGLPDLGKFPAARRARHPYASRSEQDSPASTQQQNLPPMPGPAPAPASNPMPHVGSLVFNPNVAPGGAPTVQALPAKEKDGTTVWPPAKRTLLAEQTIKFLKSDPRHEAIIISETEIIAMLESNPSYIMLCQLIEARELRFDRAYLAKHLITTVPYLSTAQQETRTPSAPTSAAAQILNGRHPVSPATFNPPPPNHAPPFMNGAFIKPETPFQRFHPAAQLMQQRNTPLSARGRAGMNTLASQIPTPVPGSKENMSRKRHFEDFIDLTDADDDYVVPEKKPHVQSISPDPIAAFAQKLQPPSQPQSSFARFGEPNPQSMLPTAAAPLRFNTHALGSSHPELKQVRPPKVMLARKLNKAEALRRNYYDPKTVARDILISTGRHPTERPLNGHLAGLLGNHIDMESDLSTFHWEDIDPGGPPQPKTAWSDIPAGPPRFKSRLPEPNRASLDETEPTKSTHKISQDLDPPRGRPVVDLSVGAGPRGPTTSSEYRGRFGSGNFARIKDLAVVESTPRSLAGLSRRDSSPGAARRAETGLRNLSQQTSHLFNNSFRPPDRRPSGLRQSQVAASEVESRSLQSPPKGRGRPLRQSNLTESSDLLLPSNKTPPRRGPGRPPRSTASPSVQISPRPAGSVRSSQRNVSVEEAKMDSSKYWPSGKIKGRPPGAKNKVHSGEQKTTGMSVQVVIPPVAAKGEKLDGEKPNFPVFKCRWSNCGAELHNLATLRKHVAKLHKPAQDIIDAIGYGCYWKKCSLLRRDEEGDFEPTPIPTEDEWMEHINEEHISSLGHKYGDGPSTQHIGKQNKPFEAIVSKYFYNPSLLPTDARIVSYTDPQAVASDRTAYLADENGRTTTHDAETNDEMDAVILTDFYTKDTEANKAAEMAFNSFLKTAGHQKQDMRAAADATFKAMVARKEKIGVGIDRGGCTLVNDERRKTFIQNPGISRVVDYDY